MQNVHETPIPSGRRNNAWLERADSIRQAMKAYWDEARNAERLDSTLSPEDTQAEIDAMSYDSAPDYLRMLQDERDAILRADQVKQNGSAMKENVQHTWQQFQQQERWSLPERPKEKPKTRVCAVTGTTDIEGAGNVASSTSSDELLAPIVSVKAESLKIFMKMFPTSSTINSDLSDSASEAEYTKGQVDWQRFVKATADASFAFMNCGGSIVSFSNAEQSRAEQHLPPSPSNCKVEQDQSPFDGQKAEQDFRMGQGVVC